MDLRQPVSDNSLAESLCPTCCGIDFAQYFQQEMHVQWNKDSSPFFVGPNPDAIRIGSLADVYSASQSCTFCNLVLAALCRNQSLWKWTSPHNYIERIIENGLLKDPAIYLYSYLYAEDSPDGIGIALNSERDDPQNSSRRGLQLGIGLRRLTSNTQSRPFLDRAAVINLVSSSCKDIGIGHSFYGRIVNPFRANMDLAKSWLEECVNSHGNLCEDLGRKNDYERIAPQDLRVIDVQNMCLVKLPPGSRYVALSYCWGSSNQHFTTKQSEIAELEMMKSLERIFSSLSGTIQDAIHCVHELGEKFLWVDALCIIQDNDQEKEAQILQMDRVYESSLVTIVSASSTLR